MTSSPVRIVIAGGGTGGHVQPAIAVADTMREIADVSLAWIGSRSGIEAEIARERGIDFHSIPAGKLRRYLSLHTIIDSVRVPAGIVKARVLLRRIKPDVIFSTGGYVSVPTVLAGWLAGIPIITHEQTATIGLANRINARFADRIALAYEATANLLPDDGRVVVTGNPVRAELRSGNADNARQAFDLDPTVPVVYVTGGSLGAHAINNTVRTLICGLVETANVVHQCGPVAMNGDYPRLQAARSELPASLQARYVVQEQIGPELADVYAAADLVVGRSGGGTVAELALLQKPAILIPLPGTSSDEQTRNARVLEDAGGAVVIEQSRLTPERLLSAIQELLADQNRRETMSEAAGSVAQPDAAELLSREILGLASARR